MKTLRKKKLEKLSHFFGKVLDEEILVTIYFFRLFQRLLETKTTQDQKSIADERETTKPNKEINKINRWSRESWQISSKL